MQLPSSVQTRCHEPDESEGVGIGALRAHLTRFTAIHAIHGSATRIAHEILEHNRGAEDLVIVGIHTRGVHLARRIADNLAKFEGVDVPVASLDISLYRDDLTVRDQSQTKIQATDIPVGIQGLSLIHI